MADILAAPSFYSLEAEQSVLGAALIDASVIPVLMDKLLPESFFRTQHQEIFKIIQSLFISGKPIDFVIILERVLTAKIFETEQAAKSYLSQLAQVVPATANIGEYVRVVQDKYKIRQLQRVMGVIVEEAQGDIDADELLDTAEQGILSIRQGMKTNGLVPMDQAVIDTYNLLQQLSGDDADKFKGIQTGYKNLDRMLGGLNKSDLLLLAARPSMGKTAFALNISQGAAQQSGKAVAIFSLEMSREQLAERVLSATAQIPLNGIRAGKLTAAEWVKLAAAAQSIAKCPIYMDDSPGISVAEMKARCRRVKNLGLVVIDYLQLIMSGQRTVNRVQEVSEITRGLKIMAKELQVPVLCLSQLSRAPETRQDHRPVLSDLRESGSIEQDADIVMFLYRDEYYHRDTESPGQAECIIAKNRHGETGTIKLRWISDFTRFYSLSTRNQSWN